MRAVLTAAGVLALVSLAVAYLVTDLDGPGRQSVTRAVPEDVSVVSVDDIALASYCTPPLTAVRQDFFGHGAAAVRLLLQDGVTVEPSAVEATLSVRASTAPPRPR